MFTEPGSHESSRDFRIGSRRERLRPKSKLPSTRRPSLPSSNTPNRWRAAGLYGGGGEGLLYRPLPRPDLHPNPPHTDGSISGFVGYADGQMNLPPKWLPATSNVVTFSKKSAKKKPRVHAGLS